MTPEEFRESVKGKNLTQKQLVEKIVEAFIEKLREKLKSKLPTPDAKISGHECLALVEECEPWIIEAGKAVGLKFKKGMARNITLAILTQKSVGL